MGACCGKLTVKLAAGCRARQPSRTPAAHPCHAPGRGSPPRLALSIDYDEL